MTVARRLPALGLVVAVVIGLAGCSDSKKSSVARDGGADSAAGPAAPGPDATPVRGDASLATCGGFGRVAACTACLEKNCCAVATDCAKSTDCAAEVACIRPCDGKPMSCKQACITGAGSTQYNALVLCMGGPCKTECPFASP